MKVREALGLHKTAGDVGIEIEVEGRNLPREINKYWRVEGDGSLRGEALEYVFRNPLSFQLAGGALDSIHKALTSRGVEVFDTGRAGTHVHVNYQENELIHVINSLVLYFVFEDLLVHFCGKSREGNLFCLRGRDAEAVIADLEKTDGNFVQLCNDNYRYSALNLKALAQYGSLEYRSMRSTIDMDGTLKPWVEMLLRLREVCQEYDHPSEIMQQYSELGPKAMLKHVFGDKLAKLLDCPDANNLIEQGLWRIQVFAFTFPVDKMEKILGKDRPQLGKARDRWVEMDRAEPQRPRVGRPAGFEAFMRDMARRRDKEEIRIRKNRAKDLNLHTAGGLWVDVEGQEFYAGVVKYSNFWNGSAGINEICRLLEMETIDNDEFIQLRNQALEALEGRPVEFFSDLGFGRWSVAMAVALINWNRRENNG